MNEFGDILVLGLGPQRQCGCAGCGAVWSPSGRARSVTAFDAAETPALSVSRRRTPALGVQVSLGASEVDGRFDICIASPGIPPHAPLMVSARSASDASHLGDRVRVRAVVAPVDRRHRHQRQDHDDRADHAPAQRCGHRRPLRGQLRPAGGRGRRSERPSEVLVAEVSSFQLAHVETFHPRVAVLAQHHARPRRLARLARGLRGRQGPGLREPRPGRYRGDRRRRRGLGSRTRSRSRRAVSTWSASAATQCSRVAPAVVDGVLVLETRGGAVRLIPADELQIRGSHNVSNALAAAAAAHALGATPRPCATGSGPSSRSSTVSSRRVVDGAPVGTTTARPPTRMPSSRR